jgi:chemotaxis protein methyltransferase CheR
MNVILCRNVLIYFEGVLQNQVLRMMRDSLEHRGFLVLGDREQWGFTHVSNDFTDFRFVHEFIKSALVQRIKHLDV